ncbi:hypothetical protein EX30DRAFT_225520 [Ascodesmis nigricans]|uniref:Uncharacterized protein n=1 Tax=Ascodesmis nigricans TaxID=341454 RepID=A0A4S2MJ20_9PEZI|nr:hypothetical protein EX30DRAFT_225520 [Ascodesmis nigricans]
MSPSVASACFPPADCALYPIAGFSWPFMAQCTLSLSLSLSGTCSLFPCSEPTITYRMRSPNPNRFSSSHGCHRFGLWCITTSTFHDSCLLGEVIQLPILFEPGLGRKWQHVFQEWTETEPCLDNGRPGALACNSTSSSHGAPRGLHSLNSKMIFAPIDGALCQRSPLKVIDTIELV